MPHTVTWIDRLRIERLVWALDQQLYDLPRNTRITNRREVRANLLAAAADVGTRQALRQLGGSRRLAQEYLTAELGDGPRHSWIAAGYFAGLVPLLSNFFMSEASNAYQAAVTAVDPHATGTFIWDGISYLQAATTYTFVDGQATSVGGAWTVTTYALWLIGTVLAGRLWRLPRISRRRRRAAAAPA
jgi:hypothetical protein